MIQLDNLISFDRMKARAQKFKLDTMFYWYLLSCDLGIFQYNNLPESIDPIFLELYLNTTGSVGIKKTDSGYMVGFISRDGELNQYGLGDNCIITTQNGEEETGVLATVGADATIIYNNPLKTPEIDILIDAVSLSDCQQSAGINVKFARIAPVFRTSNSAQTTALNELFNGIFDGNLKSIVSGNAVQNDIMGESLGETLESIDVTQPERIQYVQYLSRYMDDIARRHFSRRGLAMRTPTKAAQQSDSEINGMDSVSWYYVLQKLEERRKGIEAFNRINNESVSVEFSPIWANEYEAYKIRALKRDEAAENEMKGSAENEGNGQEPETGLPTENDS